MIVFCAGHARHSTLMGHQRGIGIGPACYENALEAVPIDYKIHAPLSNTASPRRDWRHPATGTQRGIHHNWLYKRFGLVILPGLEGSPRDK